MTAPGRVYVRPALLSLLPCLLASLLPAFSQRLPADATEMSRDLLYLAPDRIEFGTSDAPETRFIGRFFTYRYVEREGWSVRRNAAPASQAEPERKAKRSFQSAGETYTLVPDSDDDRATLTLIREGDAEPLVTAVLWNREQLAAAWLPYLQKARKGLTEASLRQELEVGDPVIHTVVAGRNPVWVAVGHSTGEGELGIGIVVRFDTQAKQARVLRPAGLSTCDVTHLVTYGRDAVLLGTRRQHEGTISPCDGLESLHVDSGQIEPITLTGASAPAGVITALGSTDRVWVATDSVICGGAPEGTWQCWRIAPTITLKSATPVANRPGEKSGGDLKPGDYEVLWANQNFLEVVTKDSFDAWLAADDFADAVARNFDAEPYKLLNSASGGPAPIRPLSKPDSDPLEGALVYRAPLEKLPSPPGAPTGWVRVRAHIGWIPRGNLEVLPKLVPAGQ